MRSSEPHVACFWHQDFFSFFPCVQGDGVRRASLVHPAWYIAPWQVVGERYGWKMALGSTGNRGRQAADELVEHLRQGYSTFVCPDGPAGPARVLKRGVLHIAAQSGAPIIPLRFELSRPIVLGGWDGKRLPLPGSRVDVYCGPSLRVAQDDVEASAARLVQALG